MQKGDVAMLKWLFIIGFVFAFVLLPQVRYTCFHLPLVFYNFVVDSYKMYYGNNKTDAKNIGFDDSFIYDELQLKPEDRKLPSEILLHNEALTAFKAWVAKEDRIEY